MRVILVVVALLTTGCASHRIATPEPEPPDASPPAISSSRLVALALNG